MQFSDPLGYNSCQTFCLNIAERSGNIIFIPEMASLLYIIINNLQTYLVDKLLVMKGWRHQLAILHKNGSHNKFNCTVGSSSIYFNGCNVAVGTTKYFQVIWDLYSCNCICKHESCFGFQFLKPFDNLFDRDPRAAGSSFTGVTMLCPWARQKLSLLWTDLT